jgi:hypothetical protein
LKKINLVAALVVCLFSAMAFAQEREDTCAPDVYKAVKQYLKINEFAPRQDGGNVISAACRIWPYKTNQRLAAFAYDEGVEHEKRLVVLIVDEKTKSVISGFGGNIAEDATTEVAEYSLKLDTARYQLGEGVRAFGIRFTSSARGASCGQGYWGNELTLFVPEGKNLRPVAALNLHQQRWLEGCPAATSRALWEDAMLTVSMSEASTNGLFDLVVTAKITVNSMEASPRNLRDRTERHTLRYNGKFYEKGKSVPWWLDI